MFQKVAKHIDTKLPFLKKAKLLIAVSGGLDSMTALAILNKLNLEVAVAHCNFKLRGNDSNLDEEFVKNWAKDNIIPCFIKKFDTENWAQSHKISIEMAARDLRYEWFNTLLKTEKFDYIITAHHANDNVETTLFNLTRGTGFKGLLGIPEVNDKIVRPFLPFSKKDFLDYAQNNGLAWREDKTNALLDFKRNKIRHQIIPVLETLNPNLITTYNNNLNHLKGIQNILSDRIETVKKEVVTQKSNGNLSLDTAKILKLSDPKAYLFELLRDYGFTPWDDVANLLTAQSGKQIFSKTHRLLKDRNELLIASLHRDNLIETSYRIDSLELGLSLPQIQLRFTDIDKSTFNKNTNNTRIFIDKAKIKRPLTVRKWQKGDYFYPFGMQNKKKLSSFFKDEKMSLLEKENIWLLCSDNNIVWIIGKRLDNRFRITPDTKNILKIDFTK